jgi:hypothetical protein
LDSRDVDRALGQEIWPYLRGVGFRRRGRTAWRDRPISIDVVNFQSLGAYLAGSLGATSHSFIVRLGVFYPAIESGETGPGVPDPTRPAEYMCHARLTPSKGIGQPRIPRKDIDQGLTGRLLHRQRFVADRSDCYFVLSDGSNLGPLVADALLRIVDAGLPWFDRLADIDQAIDAFEHDPGHWSDDGVSGYQLGGALGSPNRMRYVQVLKGLSTGR